uniref:N-lysine methyltransferase SMYD2 n=1 Tax=Lygus hesperus TaxID=30085 RepID=A0A0A9W797_LYGHE
MLAQRLRSPDEVFHQIWKSTVFYVTSVAQQPTNHYRQLLRISGFTDPPELYEGESRAIPGTSSAMSMRRSKDKGRYMVANERLPVGAILTSEEPYASVLNFDKQNNHCLHCYTRLKRVVPCPTCSGVAYCSAPCANAGQVYHQWECQFMELMIGSGMSVNAALSMRMITQSPVEYFLQLVDAIRNNDEHPHLKVSFHMK